MCGITGIVFKKGGRYENHLRRMMDSLAHRGPDGEGISSFDQCVLGHKRLSIIDLATGKQPMFSASKQIAVTFNGEIYDHKKIKKEIGHYDYKTSSDTEVLLALYEKYGKEMLRKLAGMFAFSVWDDKNKTLFSARDRFGEKPFYYAFGKNGEFLFASEIKAIVNSKLVDPVIDESSVAHYLHKLYVHPHKTIYKNIHVLPPAHALFLKEGKLDVYRYWNMPEIDNSISLEDALPEFKRLLTEAVKKQLVADVPVGAFLSGGLDSTTVVSIASKFSPRIKTFSFGYEGTKNELSFAKMAAEKYGTDHYELRDTQFKIADLFLKMADVYDEPHADSSTISTYLISKLTQEHAKVVLSGDGSDELLGGYHGWNRPIMAMTDPNIKDFPGKVLFMRILGQMAMKLNWRNKAEIIDKARGLYYRNKHKDAITAHRTSNVFFREDEIFNLGLNPNLDIPAPSWNLYQTADDAMRDDIENYMPGDILAKTDRASMANSLELRAPFLDVPFAEFALSLPYNLKIDKKEEKIILRRSFESAWPEEIRKRKKVGFGAPVDIWLKKPEMIKLADEYLNDRDKKIFQFISFKKSRKYISEDVYKKWILLVLSVWMEKHSFNR